MVALYLDSIQTREVITGYYQARGSRQLLALSPDSMLSSLHTLRTQSIDNGAVFKRLSIIKKLFVSMPCHVAA